MIAAGTRTSTFACVFFFLRLWLAQLQLKVDNLNLQLQPTPCTIKITTAAIHHHWFSQRTTSLAARVGAFGREVQLNHV
jgi:hypothetical protein